MGRRQWAGDTRKKGLFVDLYTGGEGVFRFFLSLRLLLKRRKPTNLILLNIVKFKTTMRIRNRLFVLLLMIVIATGAGKAQQYSLFDRLYQEEAVSVTVEVEVDSLLAGRRTNTYHDGFFTYTDADDEEHTLDVKTRVRGRYRRTRCGFPPLKLNFDKDQLRALGFSEYDKLKLVTHCVDARFTGNVNVLKEYMAYKMYNQLTEESYRVQLVEVTYVELGSQKVYLKRYGFLIESTSQLEERLEAVKCEDCHNMVSDSFNLVSEDRQSLFQYLIGNEDWSSRTVRNVKLLQKKNNQEILIIPYDFDFSGFVQTDYAVPRLELGVQKVQDRYFLGYATKHEILEVNILLFQSRRSEIIKVLEDFDYLPKASRRALVEYVEDFYSKLHTLPSVVATQGRGLAKR